MADSGIFVRPIIPSDRQMVADLLYYEPYVHRHLDWRQPLDWIGINPFLVGTKNGKIEAVLACPVNTPEISWIRIFAISSNLNHQDTWLELWSTALIKLENQNSGIIAAISLHDWFSNILINNRFSIVNQVVTLIHTKDNLPTPRETQLKIREMTYQDLDAVAVVDVTAFNPLWCYARNTLALSFEHTIIATVAEVDQLIVGYQISTVNHSGGHLLARLAVLPGYQGKGIGYQLLRDELERFHHRGVHRITVNTQQDNLSSLALYEQAGFKYTGEKYPVFQYRTSK